MWSLIEPSWSHLPPGAVDMITSARAPSKRFWFLYWWSFGSLPLSPLACLVGDTNIFAILLIWLYWRTLSVNEVCLEFGPANSHLNPETPAWICAQDSHQPLQGSSEIPIRQSFWSNLSVPSFKEWGYIRNLYVTRHRLQIHQSLRKLKKLCNLVNHLDATKVYLLIWVVS